MNTYYNSEEVKNMNGILKPVFVKTDRAVMSDPELSQRAKDLYYLLCSMVKRGSDSLVAYVINLAERQHKSVRTIQYALKELHERGIVIRKFRIRSNYPRRNFPSEFIIVGGNAPCYRENPKNFYVDRSLEKDLEKYSSSSCRAGCSASSESECTPILDKKKDDSITINREAEPPEKNFSVSEEKIEENPGENLEEKSLEETPGKKPEETPGEEQKEQYGFIPEVPDILQTTARYMLIRSGRSNLSPTEITVLKKLFKLHTPVRIQKEIDTAVERFIRKGRNLRCLSFNYIGKALESQKSLKPKKAAPTAPTRQTTQTAKTVRKNTMTAEEAEKIISETPKPTVKTRNVALLNVPKDISLLDYLRLKFPEEDERTFYRDNLKQEHKEINQERDVQKSADIDIACSNCKDPANCSLPSGWKKGRMRPHVIIRTDPAGFKYLYVGYGGHLECKFENVKNDKIDENLLKNSGLTSSQVQQTFESHEKTSTDVLIAKAEALKAARNRTSLILAGKPGTGKTHLASAIAIEVMKEGRKAIFKLVPALLDELRLSAMERHNFFWLMLKYKSVPCLVLDDLGKERTTRAGLDYLYQIIDYRYSHNLQTIITTNALSPESLYNQWNVDVMEPLISRILENGEWVTITDADDYRPKKRARKASAPEAVAEAPKPEAPQAPEEPQAREPEASDPEAPRTVAETPRAEDEVMYREKISPQEWAEIVADLPEPLEPPEAPQAPEEPQTREPEASDPEAPKTVAENASEMGKADFSEPPEPPEFETPPEAPQAPEEPQTPKETEEEKPVKKTWEEISESEEFRNKSEREKILAQWEYFKGTPEYEKLTISDKKAVQIDFLRRLTEAHTNKVDGG